jgi:hypothetical protein
MDDVLLNDSSFYGHPFAYGYQNWFNFDSLPEFVALKPITAVDSAQVKKMRHPAGLLPAHSVPTDADLAHVVNFDNSNDIIITLSGELNRKNTGMKVIAVDHENAKIYSYSDLLTGFVTDTLTGDYWGKPSGVAIKNKHLMTTDIYISVNQGYNCILKLRGTCPVLGLSKNISQTFTIFPNPFFDYLKFEPPLPKQTLLRLSDINGKELIKMEAGELSEVKLPNLPSGVYFLHLESIEGNVRKLIIKSNE